MKELERTIESVTLPINQYMLQIIESDPFNITYYQRAKAGRCKVLKFILYKWGIPYNFSKRKCSNKMSKNKHQAKSRRDRVILCLRVKFLKSNQIIKSNQNLSCLGLSIHSPPDPTSNPPHHPYCPLERTPGPWAYLVLKFTQMSQISKNVTNFILSDFSLINTSILALKKKQSHSNLCLLSLQKFGIRK